MAKVIDRNVNANDTAEISAGITLNISTSVKIADANEDRIYFSAECNAETASAWLKLQAATVDDDKKGLFLTKVSLGRFCWKMPSDNIYTGEISAIAQIGNPKIFVTEY